MSAPAAPTVPPGGLVCTSPLATDGTSSSSQQREGEGEGEYADECEPGAGGAEDSNEDAASSETAPSVSAKIKTRAFGAFMLGANAAKRGIKGALAKGAELRQELHKNERYMALRSRLAERFNKLPVGVQAFLSNPSADALLADPQNLFHIAGLLAAINHPQQAAFDAAVAGSAAVALASKSAQQNGQAALQGTEALTMAAAHGAAAVGNKIVPAAGSGAHHVVQAVTQHVATASKSGAPLNAASAAAAVSAAAGQHIAQGVSSATTQAIRQFTGLHVPVNFTPNEVKAMAGAIKPSDLQMILRLVAGLADGGGMRR